MQLFPFLCLLLLILGVVTLHQHHHRSKDLKKKSKQPPKKATVDPSSRDFAFDLYRALASAAPNQDVFFSPMTVSMSLAMISLAAGPDTKKQILEGLGISFQNGPESKLHADFQKVLQKVKHQTNDSQLSLGSAFFVNSDIAVVDSFMTITKLMYLADTCFVNFEDLEGARKQINDYVAKQTKGKIVDLIQTLDSTQVMVMVSYIFFKAKWEVAFNHSNTHQEDFHVAPEMVLQVPMMSCEAEYYYFQDRHLSCKVVGIPYQGKAIALFILPGEGKMQQVENGLSGKTLKKWLALFTKRQLELYLPKFSIEGSYQLEKILPKLGIRDIFTSRADLSGITGYPNVLVSEMVHQAMVEVNEAGTRAAAATRTMFMFRSALLSPLRIVFDRPFLMVIIEEPDLFFLGKVLHP